MGYFTVNDRSHEGELSVLEKNYKPKKRKAVIPYSKLGRSNSTSHETDRSVYRTDNY